MKLFFSTVLFIISVSVNAQNNNDGSSAPVLKTTNKSSSPSDTVSVNTKVSVLAPYDTNKNAPGSNSKSNAAPELAPYKKEEKPK